jgi:hypothetical protein
VQVGPSCCPQLPGWALVDRDCVYSGRGCINISEHRACQYREEDWATCAAQAGRTEFLARIISFVTLWSRRLSGHDRHF